MEKYYGKSSNTPKRSTRNKGLYSQIYTYGKYSNIEGIAEIDNANEVDITKVREMIENKENYNRVRKYRKITGDYKEPEIPTMPKRFENLEEKNYDIRDILKEAKEKQTPDNKERVLKNTKYNILKNIDMQKELEKAKKQDIPDEKEELKEMIQTITNTSMLNKLSDKDLAEDLLSDLKADDTKVGELNDVKNLIPKDKPNEQNYDHSFFTSSLKLSKSDFEGNEKKKISVFNIIIIVILILIMIASAVVLIMKTFQ